MPLLSLAHFRGLILLGAALALAGSAVPAGAHGRSVSYSSWHFDEDGVSVSLRLRALDLSRLGPEAVPPELFGEAPTSRPDLPARLFPRQLVLLRGEVPCPVSGPAQRRPDEPGWVRYRWRVACSEEADVRGGFEIRTSLLLSVAPSHLHFARIARIDGETPAASLRERVLTEAAPSFRFRRPGNAARGAGAAPETAPVGSTLRDYLALGIEHILSGWDHLAFVAGLLLLAGSVAEVARLVTGFTLAHSLTLALTVAGWVEPRAAAVEAVIAFSVALVAVERGFHADRQRATLPIAVLVVLVAAAALAATGHPGLPLATSIGLGLFTGCYFALAARSTSAWLRTALTFAFGLVHGFGFAGVLVEMQLPTERLVPALLGFNFGVEIGQLGIVVLLWPAMALAARWVPQPSRRLAGELATAGLCGIGTYWFLTRALGS